MTSDKGKKGKENLVAEVTVFNIQQKKNDSQQSFPVLLMWAYTELNERNQV